jgi:KaiC/GvpD/RAD55 family RecA-like ATPase
MIEQGNRRLRTLEIRKMRGTGHEIDMIPMDIVEGKGIKVQYKHR